MNLLQLEEGLRTGSIILDTCGHRTNKVSEAVSEYVKRNQDWIKELEAGTYVVPYDKEVWDKEKCDRMIEHLNIMLTMEVEPGKYFYDKEIHCFDCSKTLNVLVVDETHVSLIDYGSFDKQREEKGFKWLDLTFRYDTTQVPTCVAKPLVEAKKLVSEINVPTGKLLFTNFFKKDKIYDFPEDVNQYDSEHSINGILGRNSLMQYLATQNIGYGQMGNMSVNVFINKAGDEIIIGGDYGYDNDREFTIKHEGFRNLGDISLSVWRWMCGDLKVLQEHGEKVPDGLKTNKKIEEDYKDYILTKVQPGTWVIEHYYDFPDNDDDKTKIYSKLYLKK